MYIHKHIYVSRLRCRSPGLPEGRAQAEVPRKWHDLSLEDGFKHVAASDEFWVRRFVWPRMLNSNAKRCVAEICTAAITTNSIQSLTARLSMKVLLQFVFR